MANPSFEFFNGELESQTLFYVLISDKSTENNLIFTIGYLYYDEKSPQYRFDNFKGGFGSKYVADLRFVRDTEYNIVTNSCTALLRNNEKPLKLSGFLIDLCKEAILVSNNKNQYPLESLPNINKRGEKEKRKKYSGTECFFVVSPGEEKTKIQLLTSKNSNFLHKIIQNHHENSLTIVDLIENRCKQIAELLKRQEANQKKRYNKGLFHEICTLNRLLSKANFSPDANEAPDLETKIDFLMDDVLEAVSLFPDSGELYEVAQSAIERLTGKSIKEMLFQRSARNITEILETDPKLSVKIRDELLDLAITLKQNHFQNQPIQTVCSAETLSTLVGVIKDAAQRFSRDKTLCDVTSFVLKTLGNDALGPRQSPHHLLQAEIYMRQHYGWPSDR